VGKDYGPKQAGHPHRFIKIRIDIHAFFPTPTYTGFVSSAVFDSLR